MSLIIPTQNAPVDVEIVSQPNQNACSECGRKLEGYLAYHLCSTCQAPQPLREGESYFHAFDLPMKFELDVALVQKRFYEISRELHPDRFVSSSVEYRARSMARMSFLNQAFQILRNSSALREYILKLYGLRASGVEMRAEGRQPQKAAMPIELAEFWFELQEAVLDDPDQASVRVIEFEAELARLKAQGEIRLKALEAQFDRLPKDAETEILAILSQMDAELQRQNYFRSIEKDVERMKRNVSSV